jgi:hypothetical protein
MWALKQKEHKGKNLGWASVTSDRALHKCGALVWRVAVAKDAAFSDDPDVKIAVGAEALEALAKVTALTFAFYHVHLIFSLCLPCF